MKCKWIIIKNSSARGHPLDRKRSIRQRVPMDHRQKLCCKPARCQGHRGCRTVPMDHCQKLCCRAPAVLSDHTVAIVCQWIIVKNSSASSSSSANSSTSTRVSMDHRQKLCCKRKQSTTRASPDDGVSMDHRRKSAAGLRSRPRRPDDDPFLIQPRWLKKRHSVPSEPSCPQA